MLLRRHGLRCNYFFGFSAMVRCLDPPQILYQILPPTFKFKAFSGRGAICPPHVKSVGVEPMSNRVKRLSIDTHIDTFYCLKISGIPCMTQLIFATQILLKYENK